MKTLLKIAKRIDEINDVLGRWVSSLTLIMVLVTVVIVILRYGFSIGFIWMQESVRFMHGFVFLLCAAYTLLHNGHVRVDIVPGPRHLVFLQEELRLVGHALDPVFPCPLLNTERTRETN